MLVRVGCGTTVSAHLLSRDLSALLLHCLYKEWAQNSLAGIPDLHKVLPGYLITFELRTEIMGGWRG